jgi:DNA-binding NarL/FixJ family response regulator
MLVNVSLPDMSSVELGSQLRTRYPQLSCIRLSSAEPSFYVQQALTAGARGFIVKGTPDEGAEAVRHVLAGEV